MSIDIANIRSSVVRAASQFRSIKSVRLFGSYARGEHTESSDVDLIVDFQTDPDTEAYWGLLEATEAQLGVPVDLLIGDYVSHSIFKDSILEGSVYLYGEP